jgi:hypothetical protein
MFEPSVELTVLQTLFSTRTPHFVHGYPSRPSTKITSIVYCRRTTESQLTADNSGISVVPVVVADREPAGNAITTVKDFDSSLEVVGTVAVH